MSYGGSTASSPARADQPVYRRGEDGVYRTAGPGESSVEKTSGKGGLPAWRLQHASGAHAQIYEFGAHVTSWGRTEGEELLFVSEEAVFNGKRAIRGGVPICFPQFAGQGPLVSHGFARTSAWEVVATETTASNDVMVRLSLPRSAWEGVWDHAHELLFTVLLTATSLHMELSVTNTGPSPLEFTVALHTYFRVPDVASVRVRGLEGCSYDDKVTGGTAVHENSNDIAITQETDRKYFNTANELQLVGSPAGSVTISKTGLSDAVVWNPWVDKSRGMGDFGDDEYKQMTCVEAGIVGDPYQLAPGDTWTGACLLEARGGLETSPRPKI